MPRERCAGRGFRGGWSGAWGGARLGRQQARVAARAANSATSLCARAGRGGGVGWWRAANRSRVLLRLAARTALGTLRTRAQEGTTLRGGSGESRRGRGERAAASRVRGPGGHALEQSKPVTLYVRDTPCVFVGGGCRLREPRIAAGQGPVSLDPLVKSNGRHGLTNAAQRGAWGGEGSVVLSQGEIGGGKKRRGAPQQRGPVCCDLLSRPAARSSCRAALAPRCFIVVLIYCGCSVGVDAVGAAAGRCCCPAAAAAAACSLSCAAECGGRLRAHARVRALVHAVRRPMRARHTLAWGCFRTQSSCASARAPARRRRPPRGRPQAPALTKAALQ